MKTMKKILAAFCCIFFAVNVFAADNSLPEVIKGNNKDIYKYSLKNGIPVYYVENTENAVDAVSIVVKGGRTTLKPEQSGLEKALFTMMTKGSSKYSFEKRQQISYEKSASVYQSCGSGASILSVSCLNYYMDEMLPVLTDSFLNPAFTKPVYETMMTEFNQSIQSALNNPWGLLDYTVEKEAYKGHPYEAEISPNAESIGNITIDNMKKWHKTILDSRRICIVAVVSMKPEDLVKKLNSSLGSIKALKTELKEVEIPDVKISGEPVVLTHPSASGSGYIMNSFAAPSTVSEDYIPAALASSIYSTTVYNVVRTKYGACYTPGSSMNGSKANLGNEYLYMASNLKDFAKYMKKARNIMAKGKYVEKLNSDGSFEFSSIEDCLPGVKNQFINSIYSSNTTTTGRLSLYVSGLVVFDDITAYDTLMQRINAVSADDVLRVFDKYWVNGSKRWFAVVGPELESTISFEE